MSTLKESLPVRNGKIKGMGSNGINQGDGALVIQNTTHFNLRYGIIAEAGTNVVDNTIYNNSIAGLVLVDVSSTYRGNSINKGADTGQTVAGGTDMGQNSCNGAASCP